MKVKIKYQVEIITEVDSNDYDNFREDGGLCIEDHVLEEERAYCESRDYMSQVILTPNTKMHIKDVSRL